MPQRISEKSDMPRRQNVTFIHALSESKNIFVSEQKAIVLSFVKNVTFSLEHPVKEYELLTFMMLFSGQGDLCRSGLRAGCSELLTTIQNRVKPKVHIFGHIHEGMLTFEFSNFLVHADSSCVLFRLKVA